jgi:hypothetical protein
MSYLFQSEERWVMRWKESGEGRGEGMESISRILSPPLFFSSLFPFLSYLSLFLSPPPSLSLIRGWKREERAKEGECQRETLQ